jgi:hypothetical protein
MPVDGLAGPGLVETSANTLAKRMVKFSLAFEKVVSKGGGWADFYKPPRLSLQ